MARVFKWDGLAVAGMVVLGTYFLVMLFTPEPPPHPAPRHLARLSRARYQVLADYVMQAYPGKHLLIIVDKENPYNQTKLRRIRAAFADANVTWHESDPPEIEIEDSILIEHVLTSEHFNEVVHQYPEVDLVILLSTDNLPMDYSGMLMWNNVALNEYKTKHNRNPPPVVLMGAYIYDLKKYINGQQIAAVVVHKPDIVYRPDEVVPEEYRAAFDMRYLLITPDNVNAMAEKYELFEE